jgi:hypothetical protein
MKSIPKNPTVDESAFVPVGKLFHSRGRFLGSGKPHILWGPSQIDLDDKIHPFFLAQHLHTRPTVKSTVKNRQYPDVFFHHGSNSLQILLQKQVRSRGAGMRCARPKLAAHEPAPTQVTKYWTKSKPFVVRRAGFFFFSVRIVVYRRVDIKADIPAGPNKKCRRLHTHGQPKLQREGGKNFLEIAFQSQGFESLTESFRRWDIRETQARFEKLIPGMLPDVIKSGFTQGNQSAQHPEYLTLLYGWRLLGAQSVSHLVQAAYPGHLGNQDQPGLTQVAFFLFQNFYASHVVLPFTQKV